MSIYDKIANPMGQFNPVRDYMQGQQFRQQNALAQMQMEQARAQAQQAQQAQENRNALVQLGNQYAISTPDAQPTILNKMAALTSDPFNALVNIKKLNAPAKQHFSAPFGVTGPDGKQIMATMDETGNIKPLTGYSPIKRQGMSVTTPDGTTLTFGGNGEPLQKSTVARLEKNKFDAVDALSRLDSTRNLFKPEYLELGTRWNAIASGWKEKAGFRLDPRDQQSLSDFSKFKRNAIGNVNRTISDLTGAAMGVEEAKRLTAEVPNPGSGLFDGDSPTQFKAKLDDSERNLRRAIIRYNYATQNNLDPLKTGIELSDVDNLVEKRGKELETAFASQNRGADPQVIKMMVRDQLAKEFGLQ